jgi:fatty acid kinase fatty acid binding subunit
MVAVVADSACNLPGNLAREHAITIVPMYVSIGGETFRDGVDVTAEHVYELLVRQARPVTTSTPSPGDYLQAFRASGGQDIVCVTVASSMSSSHQQATSAAGEFEGRVIVVDSQTASMAEGFVALAAARAAREAGATAASVAARARAVADRARLIATIGTFEFLKRSGRVSALQAFAAAMLDVKPVFEFRRGEAVPLARTRTRRRALDRIAAETLRAVGDRPLHLAVIHAGVEAEAEALAARIETSANVVERLVVPATPVVGAHTGPGLIGTASFVA